MLIDIEEIIPQEGLTIDQWQEKSLEWIDYQKWHRLFSVFAEEELERQLG